MKKTQKTSSCKIWEITETSSYFIRSHVEMEVQVRYFVKAAIVRDWKWNHKVKQHLMVNGILDLNMHPSAKHEGNSRDHKRLCCFCCKSGPISAVIATNR